MQSLPGDVLAGISDLNKGPSDKNGLEGGREGEKEGGRRARLQLQQLHIIAAT